MNRRSIILGVAVGLAAVAAVAGYQFMSGGRARLTMACAYPDCDWAGAKSVQPGDTYPPTCPACGRASVLPLATCRQCGHQQLLNEQIRATFPDLAEGVPAETRCVECGNQIRHGD